MNTQYIIEKLKGDEKFEQLIEENTVETNRLLKLLVEIYDQKNLALLARDILGEKNDITREKLNRWKATPDANTILLNEEERKQLKEALLPKKPKHWDNPAFTFVDLFAGIGGIRKGFEEVGGRCKFTSEWDKAARRTYLANHYVPDEELAYFLDKEEENPSKNVSFMDITKITRSGDPDATTKEKEESIKKHIPEHDLLLAGFPCQPFSLAGVSKKNSLGRAHGFKCETQGTLFFDVEQILRVRKPNFFVLENVKNLKSHDKGNTFATIIHTLDDAGYWVANITDQGQTIEESIEIVRKRKPEPTIVDGVHFTPQHRERIVLVGVKKELINSDPRLREISLTNLPKPENRYTLGEILCELTDQEKGKYTLTPNLWAYLYHYALKHATKGNGFGFGLVNPRDPKAVTRTLSARYYKDGSEILINQDEIEPEYLNSRKEPAIRKNQDREQHATKFANTFREENPQCTDKEFKDALKLGFDKYDELYGKYAKDFNPLYKTPRRLMPRECARLMGFEIPEKDRMDHDSNFRIVCADTAAYKQFGNSVVVPVFRAVAKLIKPYIELTKF
jgi:DNA (cytosine-5)-methyltransferase 1